MSKFDHCVAEMKILYDTGVSFQAVGKKFGCSHVTVGILFKKHNIACRKTGVAINHDLVDFVECRYLKGMTCPEIASEIKAELPQIYKSWKHPLVSIYRIVRYHGLMRLEEVLSGLDDSTKSEYM